MLAARPARSAWLGLEVQPRGSRHLGSLSAVDREAEKMRKESARSRVDWMLVTKGTERKRDTKRAADERALSHVSASGSRLPKEIKSLPTFRGRFRTRNRPVASTKRTSRSPAS